MKRLALLACVTAFAVAAGPAYAGSGRVAVGVDPSHPVAVVAAAVEEATGEPVDQSLSALDLIVVRVDDVEAALPRLKALPGVEYAEAADVERRLAFVPNDPLAAPFQWYLGAVHMFDYWPDAPPAGLAPVRVAVIDSGVDGSHPDLRGRVVASQSFVDTKALEDSLGHGTMVAGEIGATLDNSIGIAGGGAAGPGLPTQLLIAKVVKPNRDIPIIAEVRAIKWAVQNGARVINLSLGGGTYSAPEQAAVDYAYQHGAVVVAATGNCTTSRCPEHRASYPGALPHVLGVSAIGKDGAVPRFSNRDPLLDDIAAPGSGIVSTYPTDLPALADCQYPGYSVCAADPLLQQGAGTSFAVPLVSAAAALLIASDPGLAPDQVMRLLEDSADDIGAPGHDAATGFGRLDVAAALRLLKIGTVPPADRLEPNDDAGTVAHTLYFRRRTTVRATIDAYDDPTDVYRIFVRRGQRLVAALTGLRGGPVTLVLWRPGTEHVSGITQVAVKAGVVVAFRTRRNPILVDKPPATGWYYLQVRAPKGGGGEYKLTVSKFRSQAAKRRAADAPAR